ncbi:DNA-3-methyladenine glycosylase [Aquella oligotrophica]|uniref:Putative 3-methyladenine DNA glycosylase n=1 Tax=Aquella oligotrophica TaxID=2067065 RepID=A0A2I7N6Y4_9NEIS|nr:DNA-3-methyladenine glycosylase [Aquella oligotrophica]AUR51975.1 3-methyladenine DNA glycosylase [Aquella oligotrophica]
MILDKRYFSNSDTVFLAQDILGKMLVRTLKNGLISRHRITETEAYHGEDDKACHARFGKTERNQIMYQEGGIWYVYLCYGIHWLLNIVTGEKDFPSAILIRGVTNISGPGRVTKQLQIDKTLNGAIADYRSGLWIEDDGFLHDKGSIIATPRVGVDYAGECALKPWRFIFTDKIRDK